jgi:uncharacterized membrane protein YhaH (DUF805 family)
MKKLVDKKGRMSSAAFWFVQLLRKIIQTPLFSLAVTGPRYKAVCFCLFPFLSSLSSSLDSNCSLLSLVSPLWISMIT